MTPLEILEEELRNRAKILEEADTSDAQYCRGLRFQIELLQRLIVRVRLGK